MNLSPNCNFCHRVLRQKFSFIINISLLYLLRIHFNTLFYFYFFILFLSVSPIYSPLYSCYNSCFDLLLPEPTYHVISTLPYSPPRHASTRMRLLQCMRECVYVSSMSVQFTTTTHHQIHTTILPESSCRDSKARLGLFSHT